ncbi:hypothetical protein PU560_16560 [Georgenia sp. 10Sc9-8]|uniref:Uncharacterized protein n=1 Tax=Georgenia halotolerans TaxID=3028317 RepID=A0ABT5U153_9MICO|nr:hypothetical protein [Georgenia halotolerans]
MKAGQLIKVAAVAGPTVWRIVRTAGPTLVRLRQENPDVFDAVQRQVTALAKARQERSGPTAVRRRLEVLRQQVTYLAGSADDAAEAERAAGWSRDLDGVERALPLVVSENRRTARRHLRRIERRLDTLSGQILEAFIGEQEEDAGADR